MLTIGQCRAILGERAASLSDAQVLHIRDSLKGMAQFLVDKYVQEHGLDRTSSPRDPTANQYEH